LVNGQWKNRIATLTAEGRRIVVWGAGTKAVGLLNMLHISIDDGISYVVDINPRESRRFVPGTAQQIVPPEHLREYGLTAKALRAPSDAASPPGPHLTPSSLTSPAPSSFPA